MADVENAEGTGGPNEEIEMEEIEGDDEGDEEGTEETNLDDDTEGDENLEWDDDSILVPKGPQGFNPDLGDIPDDPRGLKRVFTRDRKIFLKNTLDVSLNKGDGPNSKILFDNLQLTNDQRSGKNNGAKFKGVKIIVVKDGRYEYSSNSNEKTTQAIAEFKATLEKAKTEHGKTAVKRFFEIGETEKQFNDAGVDDISQEDVVSVLSSIEEQLSSRLVELEDSVLEVRRGGLTKAEVDELIGVLSFDRTGNMSSEDQIKTLTEVEIPFWKEKLNESEEGNNRKKQITGIVEMMEIKSDIVRIRNNQKPETAWVKKLIKEDVETGDISRFKKFSKWARENLLGLSVVAISTAQ